MQTGDWPRYPVFRDGLPPVTLCSGVHVIITCHLRVQREPGQVTPFPQRTLVTSPQVTVTVTMTPHLRLWMEREVKREAQKAESLRSPGLMLAQAAQPPLSCWVKCSGASEPLHTSESPSGFGCFSDTALSSGLEDTVFLAQKAMILAASAQHIWSWLHSPQSTSPFVLLMLCPYVQYRQPCWTDSSGKQSAERQAAS